MEQQDWWWWWPVSKAVGLVVVGEGVVSAGWEGQGDGKSSGGAWIWVINFFLFLVFFIKFFIF